MHRSTTPLLLVLLLATACTSSRLRPDDPLVTSAELIEHVRYLASDELRGRETGSPGYNLAADYAAEVFRDAGVEPGSFDEKGNTSYFQPVPLLRMARGASARIEFDLNGTPLTLDSDQGTLIIAHPGTDSSQHELEFRGVVHVGAGIHRPESGVDDLAGLDLHGKLVILRTHTPHAREGEPWLSDSLDALYRNPIRGLSLRLNDLRDQGAAGVLILAGPSIKWRWNALRRLRTAHPILPRELTTLTDPQFEHPPVFITTKEAAYSLVQALPEVDPTTGYRRSGEMTGVQARLREHTSHTTIEAANVIGIIPGHDPELRNEYVCLTAHLDHIGANGFAINRGANDNGSGSAALLEAAEELAADPPARSVLVMLVTGEEQLFLGSSYFIEHSTIPLTSIVAELNMDQVGRSEQAYGLAVIGPASWNDFFSDAGKAVAGLNLSLIPPDAMMGYYMRSDQVVFHREGIPSFFITTGQFEGYHSPADTPERIDLEMLTNASRFVAESIRQIGNTPELKR